MKVRKLFGKQGRVEFLKITETHTALFFWLTKKLPSFPRYSSGCVRTPPKTPSNTLYFFKEACGKPKATHGIAWNGMNDGLDEDLFPGTKQKSFLPFLKFFPNAVTNPSKRDLL